MPPRPTANFSIKIFDSFLTECQEIVKICMQSRVKTKQKTSDASHIALRHTLKKNFHITKPATEFQPLRGLFVRVIPVNNTIICKSLRAIRLP